MKYEILPYERVRNLRIDRNLKQREVAQVLNIKQSTYAQYETGALRYPLEVLIKLADFYNTSVDYLIGITDDSVPHERKR